MFLYVFATTRMFQSRKRARRKKKVLIRDFCPLSACYSHFIWDDKEKKEPS